MQVLKGIVFRYRAGCLWRDLPERFGPWQTVWKRHARFSRDGTWDRILTELLADAEGDLDWRVSVDSTVCRVHQLGAGLTGRFPSSCRRTGLGRMTRIGSASRSVTGAGGPAAR